MALVPCPECSRQISNSAPACPNCGWAPDVPRYQRELSTPHQGMQALLGHGGPASTSGPTSKLLGISGSAILFAGVFAPIMSVPFAGNQNYFQNGTGDGVILIGLAIVALILSLAGLYRGLWFPGLGALAMLGFTFISFRSGMNEIRANMEQELAGNPFAGLAELAMQSVQLQWGWAVLIIGALMIVAAAALAPRTMV